MSWMCSGDGDSRPKSNAYKQKLAVIFCGSVSVINTVNELNWSD